MMCHIMKIIKEDFDIVLTGAGTSEFIGNSLYQALNGKYGYKVKSYATTDIVPSPEAFLSRTKPTILVSFGRSGNSPETVGAVDAAEVVCQNLYHLFITCNHKGTLSKVAEDRAHCFAINLTPETHDQSFAMTSRFSNMYMAACLAFNLDRLEEITSEIDKVCAAGTRFLEEGYTLAQQIVDDFDFDRIVYLGNVALKGVSQESALKMLELTAGQVATMYDSPLGFRHGPKSIIDDRTFTVLYLSDILRSLTYNKDHLLGRCLMNGRNGLLQCPVAHSWGLPCPSIPDEACCLPLHHWLPKSGLRQCCRTTVLLPGREPDGC